MIITVSGITEKTNQELINYLNGFHVGVQELTFGGEQYLIVAGDERGIDLNKIESLPGVQHINTNVHPFHFASLDYQKEPTIIRVGDAVIGGNEIALMAGPCAVEHREDLVETALAAKKAGAQFLRAGGFKPRTTPHNFQGLGRKGVELLAEVGREVGMPIVTEVMNPEDVAWMEEIVDVFQVGTRNMTNTSLLKRLGKSNRPVILKRSFSAKIEEWIRAAEFILVGGNPNVALCERGIQSVETYTRFTLDLSAVPVAKELTHLPVVVDPSHGTGKPSLIPPMSKAAIAAGADGLMIEIHVAPERMCKPGDGPQALLPHQFEQLVHDLKGYAELAGRKVVAE